MVGFFDLVVYKEKVMMVVNVSGELIYSGELGKVFEIIVNGGDVDYVGVFVVELIGSGEFVGNYC